MTQRPTGAYRGITNHDYHNDPQNAALSSSALRKLAISGAHYYDYITRPHEPPTPAMVFGSAAHTLILEPDQWGIEVEVKKTVSKAAREETAASGKYLITQDDSDAIHRMRDNLMRKQIAQALWSGAVFEESIFWDDLHDIRCKCRPDLRNSEYKIMADLKTAQSAEQRAFRNDAFRFKYGLQGKVYQRGVERQFNEAYQFLFIVVEKSAPYDCAFYLMDELFLEWARVDDDTIPGLLDALHRCKMSGNWPGYPDEIVRLSN